MIEQVSVWLPGLLAPLRQGESRHPISTVERRDLRALFALAARREPAVLTRLLAHYVGSVHADNAAAVAAALRLPSAPAWLFAAPVWLRPEHAGIYLLGSRPLQMSADDAAACCAELNGWLGQDGMQLYPVTPSRWLLALPEAPALQWTALVDAIGCDLRHVAAQGEGSLRWQARLTEWQMLLNQSPLNQARQQRGLPPIHSLWLWGNASSPPTSPAVPSTPLVIMAVDSLLARTQPAHSLESLLQQAPTQATVIDERLHDAFVHGDIAGYQHAYAQVWRQTLAPLLAALQSHQIGALQLCPDDGFAYQLQRKSVWTFWQRAPLPALLQGH
ncbi:MAG: hypothetical protein ACK4E7_16605 [Permianibacter sp.]